MVSLCVESGDEGYRYIPNGLIAQALNDAGDARRRGNIPLAKYSLMRSRALRQRAENLRHWNWVIPQPEPSIRLRYQPRKGQRVIGASPGL